MRLARCGEVGTESPIVDGGDGIRRDLRPIIDDVDGDFLSTGFGALAAASSYGKLPVFTSPIERLGPPLVGVGKVVCVGLNYIDHVREMGEELPSEPVMFLKAPDTLVGPNDSVLIPRLSDKTDWEVELAVVIRTQARYLESPSDALSHVAGYSISNDVSERDFQLERGGQWDKGKNCETFNPFGPWLVSTDEIGDPQDLELRLWVNGDLRQNVSTSEMIFGVAHLVWYLSQFLVLRPGDVINTGTPAGVSLGRADQPYLRAGDVVELEIERLGRQRQVLEAA